MKRNLLLIITMLVLTTTIAGCGNGKSNKKKQENTSTYVNETENTSNDVAVKEPETKHTISAVKEDDAVIDFNGIKLPINITYQEFLNFMEENNWEWTSAYAVDEEDLPNESKGDYSGECYLNTNCGRVVVRFMANEDNTCSVLRNVKFDQPNISIAGISINTPAEVVKEVLEIEHVGKSSMGFYLDDYLFINYIDDNYLHEGYDTISVERKFFHMR